jgi:hypothetical protein
MKKNTNSQKVSSHTHLGEATIPLYPVKGIISSVREFAENGSALLAPHEREFLLSRIDKLAGREQIPAELDRCLAMSSSISERAQPYLEGIRSGERSVLLPEMALQLKGCLPMATETSFPTELLPFDSDQIQRSTIPFGIMTGEAVMREILGNCFMEAHGLNHHIEPLCVWQYPTNDGADEYCLVSRFRSRDRIEDFIEQPNCSVGDIIRWQEGSEAPPRDMAIGSEIRLQGLNLWPYIEAKSRLICGMHLRGGFRGILNSNFGNDVLLDECHGSVPLALCDFDTFFMVPVPDAPDAVFLEKFALHCLVEIIMGSLPILFHVKLPSDCTPKDQAEALGAVYFAKSSLWRAYRRHLFSEAKALGWDLSVFGKALEKACRAPACADVLSTRVLNNQYFATMGRERKVYFPHGLSAAVVDESNT